MRAARHFLVAGLLVIGSALGIPNGSAQKPAQVPDNVDVIRDIEYGKVGERALIWIGRLLLLLATEVNLGARR